MTTKRVKVKDPYFSVELVDVDEKKELCSICHGAGKLSVIEGNTIGVKKCIVCAGRGTK